MKHLSWSIGACRITAIVELPAIGKVIQDGIPQALAKNIQEIPWLFPHFATKDGQLLAVVQAFIIQTPTSIVVVDTCVGNDKERNDIPAWGQLQTDFLDQLKMAGYTTDQVTHVCCTHLHFDHVGWNTFLRNGQWEPTFPRARYLFSKKEYAYWQSSPAKEIKDDLSGFADSVVPIFQAGLAELIDHNYRIDDQIYFIPTPGHTIDHISVCVHSGDQKAIILGDSFHHPCQVARPEWATSFDYDPHLSTQSRQEILQSMVDTNTIMMGAHFAAPTAGRIERDGTSYKFITNLATEKD